MKSPLYQNIYTLIFLTEMKKIIKNCVLTDTNTLQILQTVTGDKKPEYLMEIETKVWRINDPKWFFVREIVVKVTVSNLNKSMQTEYYVKIYLDIKFNIAIMADIFFDKHNLTNINQITVAGIKIGLLTCATLLINPEIQKISVYVDFKLFTQKDKITKIHTDFLEHITFLKRDRKRLYEQYYPYKGDFIFRKK